MYQRHIWLSVVVNNEYNCRRQNNVIFAVLSPQSSSLKLENGK